MMNTQHIIERLHESGYSAEFIAKAINYLGEQPEAIRKNLSSPIQFIVDNEYLINCRPKPEASTKKPTLKTTSNVFALIEPADPDSIRSQGGNVFLLNWLVGGFTSEQLASLRANKAITILKGPYKPDFPEAIAHQIKIKVL